MMPCVPLQAGRYFRRNAERQRLFRVVEPGPPSVLPVPAPPPEPRQPRQSHEAYKARLRNREAEDLQWEREALDVRNRVLRDAPELALPY